MVEKKKALLVAHLPPRILLQPRHSCQIKWSTGPISKRLVESIIYTPQTCKYRSQVKKKKKEKKIAEISF